MISLLTLVLAPTFFVMLRGYTAGRVGIVNNMHVAELNTVVMGYALPSGFFGILFGTSYPPLPAIGGRPNPSTRTIWSAIWTATRAKLYDLA
jgi:hypothetical protein